MQRGITQRANMQKSNMQKGIMQRANTQKGNTQKGITQRANTQKGITQKGNTQRGIDTTRKKASQNRAICKKGQFAKRASHNKFPHMVGSSSDCRQFSTAINATRRTAETCPPS